MPFYELSSGGEIGPPVDSVDLRHLPAEGFFRKIRFQLMKGIAFQPIGGIEPPVHVPSHDLATPDAEGQSTDLASVPPMLWGVISSYGMHTMAAILHDKLCKDAASLRSSRTGLSARATADRIFRAALKETDVPAVKRWVMWAAVRIFGVLSHAWPLGILVLLGVVALAAGPYLAFRPEGWWPTLWELEGSLRWVVAGGALVVPVILLFFRNDLGLAMPIATLMLWIVLVILVNLVALLLLWVGPGLVWLVRKAASLLPRIPDPGPAPGPGPTRAAP